MKRALDAAGSPSVLDRQDGRKLDGMPFCDSNANESRVCPICHHMLPTWQRRLNGPKHASLVNNYGLAALVFETSGIFDPNLKRFIAKIGN